MREGEEVVKHTSCQTLKLLGTVGELIDPEAWLWYYNIVGEKRCPNCRHMVANRNRRYYDCPFAGSHAFKTWICDIAFFGSKKGEASKQSLNYSALASWLGGQMQTIYGDPERLESTVFFQYPGDVLYGLYGLYIWAMESSPRSGVILLEGIFAFVMPMPKFGIFPDDYCLSRELINLVRKK